MPPDTFAGVQKFLHVQGDLDLHPVHMTDQVEINAKGRESTLAII